MGIYKNIEISLADSLSVSAFGRLRTAGEGNRVDYEPTYSSNDEITDEVINGTGTVVHNSNPRDLTLATGGTGLTASAGLYTYPAPYTPGNGQEIEITGVLDYANLGGGSETVEVFLRSNITGSPSDLKTISSTEWGNQDIVTSRKWDKSHIFFIDLQSLKVGRVRFGMVVNGIAIPLAQITNDNLRDSGYWQYAQQSVFWNIYNSGGNTIMEIGYGDNENAVGFRYTMPINGSASMKAICATVKSEGGLNILDMPTTNRGVSNLSNSGSTVTVGNTFAPIISIKPSILFKTLPNRGIALPKSISIYTDNPIWIQAIHNGTLTGGSFNPVDPTNGNSIMEYDVAATSIANGSVVLEDNAGGSKNTGSTQGNLLGETLLWNRRGSATGILTIAGQRLTTTNATVNIAINWGEII